MPWSQTSPLDHRTKFIADSLRRSLDTAALCERFGIARKTGYNWIDCYLRLGPAGLEERSRKPHESPNQTDPEIVAAPLEARRRHSSWGAKKLLPIVHQRHPRWSLPGPIDRVRHPHLPRHGGQEAHAPAHRASGQALEPVSSLSAGWVRLEVLPELSEPGKPQQNGRHERMHRTLKAETTGPPASGLRAQQRRFDRFREESNTERSHEGLGSRNLSGMSPDSSVNYLPDRSPWHWALASPVQDRAGERDRRLRAMTRLLRGRIGCVCQANPEHRYTPEPPEFPGPLELLAVDPSSQHCLEFGQVEIAQRRAGFGWSAVIGRIGPEVQEPMMLQITGGRGARRELPIEKRDCLARERDIRASKVAVVERRGGIVESAVP